MNKLLIVGCGELGSRFLQAACAINEFSIIEIVEPNIDAINIAKIRANELLNTDSITKLNFYNDITQVNGSGSIAIIATQADTRDVAFKSVIDLGYKNIILEKIVTQSIDQYKTMMQLAELKNVKVWVNCKTRCYPIWKYIKSKISANESIRMYSIGGNHGLCTNGVHTLDLFNFLTDCNNYSVNDIKLDNLIFKTKRNKYDTSGIISFKNSSNIITLDYNNKNMQMPTEIVITDTYKWVIDNGTKQAFEFSLQNQNSFTEIPYEGDLSVSSMSRIFILDILNSNKCELPSLKDCFLAHTMIFNTMIPHFNKIFNDNSKICPIT